MNRNYNDRWADNDYEELSESCRLGPSKSNSSASQSTENALVQESSETEFKRRFGLTEVDSSLHDAIVRVKYVQNELNKITLTNKTAEFCELLRDFLQNIEEIRLKLEAMLSPFANLEQISADLITDSDRIAACTTTSPISDNTSTEQT
ncbi:hypothetical protein ACH3XW_24350 [Acanthocheilonema viteae]